MASGDVLARSWPPETFLRRVVPSTVRATLGWLFASTIVPLALATAGLLVLQTNMQEGATRERMGALAETLVRAVDAELERHEAVLQALAVSPQLRAGDFRGLHEFARRMVRSRADMSIALVDSHGQALFSTSLEWGAALPNVWQLGQEKRRIPWNGYSVPVSSGDLTRRALHNDAVAYSDLYFAAKLNRPALAVALPASGPKGNRYALMLSISPFLLQEMVRRSVAVPGVRVAVADRNGLVVATNAASRAEVGRAVVLTPAMLQDRSGVFTITGNDGAKLEGSFAISSKNGFIARVAEPAPALLTRASSLSWVGLYIGVFSVGLAVVYFHSRRLTAPLRQLAAAVAEGRSPGPYRGGIAEIDLLSQAVGVAAEATALRRESDRRTIGELQDRALFAEQMVGIVSHDVRNPLLVAQFSADAMQTEEPSLAGNVHLVHLRAALQRAQNMVRELLDFTRARIGSGIPVDLAPVDLHALVEDGADALRRAYPHRRLTHEKQGEGRCEADAARLAQAMDNLVNNAVAYGAPDTPITIRSVVAEGFFAIEVHNAGEPIGIDVLPRIFEPMVRSTESRAKRPGGVGLGLYIVRKIAEAHGGEVTVVSDANAGTTFRANFPR